MREMSLREITLRCVVLLAALAVPALSHAAAATDDIGVCPRLGENPDAPKFTDYRLRTSDSFTKWSIDDNFMGHTGPAQARVRQGELSHRVMTDLDFTLIRFPNHLIALKTLIEYDLAGGKPFEFFSTACYLDRARAFVPDDASVTLAQAYYYWKKGKLDRAREIYEEAIGAQPTFAEAHYNIGLLFFEMRDYAKAREHAQVAYANGYPLAGLRNKLKSVGQWTTEPSGKPATAAR